MKSNTVTLLLAVMLIVGGCAKQHVEVWETTDSKKSLSEFELIQFDTSGSNSSNEILIIESIATEMSRRGLFVIEPPYKADELVAYLKDFQYEQKLRTVSDDKRAVIKVSLILDDNTKLLEQKKPVTLYSCNNLKKKGRCRKSGKSVLRNGIKRLELKLNLTVSIETGSGNPWHEIKVNSSYSKEGSSIPDTEYVKVHLFRQAARVALKGMIPQKTKVELVLKDDANELAAKMISAGAYKSAMDHLLRKKSDELTSGDYYHLGLSSELTQDLSSALRYYNTALDIEHDEHISSYQNRINRIINN
jgi:hypothetical protein